MSRPESYFSLALAAASIICVSTSVLSCVCYPRVPLLIVRASKYRRLLLLCQARQDSGVSQGFSGAQ
jgi:hypothetical protein